MIRYLIALPDTYILNNRIYPFVNSLLIKTIEGLSELTQPPSSTIISGIFFTLSKKLKEKKT